MANATPSSPGADASAPEVTPTVDAKTPAKSKAKGVQKPVVPEVKGKPADTKTHTYVKNVYGLWVKTPKESAEG